MKIWGVRSGLIGDTIMAMPALAMLKKKYHGCYINWVIDKKCSQLAPIYLNHPLIDRIKVTDEWLGFGPHDKAIMANCDLVIDLFPQQLEWDWFNRRGCVENTLLMAGLSDYDKYLSSEEMYPELVRWFPDPSSTQPENHGYTFNESVIARTPKLKVGIFPFANYGVNERRSPTKGWWDAVCTGLDGAEISHFGWMTEPDIMNTKRFTHLSLFEQIKMTLECDIVLGTDSGSMWVVGAYSKPAIHIMTYHMPGHCDNPHALAPMNKNGTTFFSPDGCDRVKPGMIISEVRKHEKNLFGRGHDFK